MIYYCHRNPQHHDFVRDFRDWEFSSYNAIIRSENTLVVVEKVIQRFEDVAAFKKAHSVFPEDKELDKYIIE